MDRQRLRRSFPNASKNTIKKLSELAIEYNQQKDSINMTKLWQEIEKNPDLKKQLGKRKEKTESLISSLLNMFSNKQKQAKEQKQKTTIDLLNKSIGPFSDYGLLSMKDLGGLRSTKKQLGGQLSQFQLINTLHKFPVELISGLTRPELRIFFQSGLTGIKFSDIHPLMNEYMSGQLYIFLRLFKKYFPENTMMWFPSRRNYYFVWRGHFQENEHTGRAVLIIHSYISAFSPKHMFNLNIYTEKLTGFGKYCTADATPAMLKKLIKSSVSNVSSSIVIHNCQNNYTSQKIFNNIIFTPDKVDVRPRQYLAVHQAHKPLIQQLARQIGLSGHQKQLVH